MAAEQQQPRQLAIATQSNGGQQQIAVIPVSAVDGQQQQQQTVTVTTSQQQPQPVYYVLPNKVASVNPKDPIAIHIPDQNRVATNAVVLKTLTSGAAGTVTISKGEPPPMPMQTGPPTQARNYS